MEWQKEALGVFLDSIEREECSSHCLMADVAFVSAAQERRPQTKGVVIVNSNIDKRGDSLPTAMKCGRIKQKLNQLKQLDASRMRLLHSLAREISSIPNESIRRQGNSLFDLNFLDGLSIQQRPQVGTNSPTRTRSRSNSASAFGSRSRERMTERTLSEPRRKTRSSSTSGRGGGIGGGGSGGSGSSGGGLSSAATASEQGNEGVGSAGGVESFELQILRKVEAMQGAIAKVQDIQASHTSKWKRLALKLHRKMSKAKQGGDLLLENPTKISPEKLIFVEELSACREMLGTLEQTVSQLFAKDIIPMEMMRHIVDQVQREFIQEGKADELDVSLLQLAAQTGTSLLPALSTSTLTPTPPQIPLSSTKRQQQAAAGEEGDRHVASEVFQAVSPPKPPLSASVEDDHSADSESSRTERSEREQEVVVEESQLIERDFRRELQQLEQLLSDVSFRSLQCQWEGFMDESNIMSAGISQQNEDTLGRLLDLRQSHKQILIKAARTCERLSPFTINIKE